MPPPPSPNSLLSNKNKNTRTIRTIEKKKKSPWVVFIKITIQLTEVPQNYWRHFLETGPDPIIRVELFIHKTDATCNIVVRDNVSNHAVQICIVSLSLKMNNSTLITMAIGSGPVSRKCLQVPWIWFYRRLRTKQLILVSLVRLMSSGVNLHQWNSLFFCLMECYL